MTITGYKRLTIVLSGLICVLLLQLFFVYSDSWTWKNRERDAWDAVHDYARTYDYVLRSNADPHTAAEMLYQIWFLPSHKFTDGPIWWTVQQEREHYAKDLIEYLRKKTGQDLGDNPTNWVQKFAPDCLKY